MTADDPEGPKLFQAICWRTYNGCRLGRASMKRRFFIAGLVGTTLWPLVARAQPAPGKWRIGLLMQRSRQDPLLKGLRKLGYIEGNNLLIEVRPNDRADQLVQFAAELVALKPDVIATAGTQATQTVQQATKSIPIVMVASDPVE